MFCGTPTFPTVALALPSRCDNKLNAARCGRACRTVQEKRGELRPTRRLNQFRDASSAAAAGFGAAVWTRNKRRCVLHCRGPTSAASGETLTTSQKDTSNDSYIANPSKLVQQEDVRWLLVSLVAAAYVVWTMCKVNLSITILPMSQQYAWDASQVGIIQAALYWGYALSQLPGGFLATRFGAKRVLLSAVIAWSLMTLLTPWAAATSVDALVVSRFLVGLGEGLAPPSGVRVVSTWMPEAERSRAVALFGSGSKLGNIVVLTLAPSLIAALGSQAVFYVCGVLGLIWAAIWAALGRDKDPCGPESCSTELPEVSAANDNRPIPWLQIISSPPVWGVFLAHFGNNWGMFGLLTWLPTYLNKELGYDLQGSSFVTILPSIFGILCAALAGSLADELCSKGWDLTNVRKVSQSIAFVVPAVCLGLLGTADLSGNGFAAPVVLLVLAVGFSSFSYAGLYSSHIDLNAKYAGLVNGLSTTVGAVAGTLANVYCGNTLASTSSWAQALFIPSVTFYLLGLLAYNKFYDSAPLDWDSQAGTETVS